MTEFTFIGILVVRWHLLHHRSARLGSIHVRMAALPRTSLESLRLNRPLSNLLRIEISPAHRPIDKA